MSDLISPAAVDLIVAEEVSSQAAYTAHYTRPEWPGGRSGVTIGIGYDVGGGVRDANQLRSDWQGHISDAMIDALVPCIGVTGKAAQRLLTGVRAQVMVPWDAAMAVFRQVDVPRWYAKCARVLPNFESLPPDCKGVLVSLAYNRGPSFTLDGDRYREMREIRAAMAGKNFTAIPAALRAMKRLWPNQSERGLPLRREHEAVLFERGLKEIAIFKPVKPAQPASIPAAKPAAPVKPVPEVAAGGAIVVAGGATVTAAHQQGIGGGVLLGLAIGVLVLALVVAVAVRAWRRNGS